VLWRKYVVVVAGLVALPGCTARVNDPINATLAPGTKPEVVYEIPAVSSERTIRVEASSSESEIDVYVIKKDVVEIATVPYEKRAERAFAAKQQFKSDSVEAKVPANTEAAVVVVLCEKGTLKRSEVTGKITSK
jgi:hypothetical protein